MGVRKDGRPDSHPSIVMDDVAKKPSILQSEQSDADIDSEGVGDEHHQAEPPTADGTAQNPEEKTFRGKDPFWLFPLGRDIAGLKKFVHEDLGAVNL